MDRKSDAELVEILKYVQANKNATRVEQASGLGLKKRQLQDWIAEAKARGITAETKVVDPAARVKALEAQLKQVGAQCQRLQRDLDAQHEAQQKLFGLFNTEVEVPEWMHEQRDPKSPGVPVVVWSDWHYGETVDFEETGGLNKYNIAIANKRIDTLVNSTLDLTHHHMVNPSYEGIVVCLGGDMVSGMIHDELTETNELYLTECIEGLKVKLASALSALADVFGCVYVECVVGNHGRLTQRPRFKGKVKTNAEYLLYKWLKDYFAIKGDTRVRIHVPNQTDAYFAVYGHRFLLTHGDCLGVKGGDGIIGAIGPIARGAVKIGRAESQIGRDFDTLIMGHWHTYIPRGQASPVIVNGALKGYDEYARLQLRVPYSQPSQALFFVHKKYGITAQWQVFCDKDPLKRNTDKWVSWQE